MTTDPFDHIAFTFELGRRSGRAEERADNEARRVKRIKRLAGTLAITLVVWLILGLTIAHDEREAERERAELVATAWMCVGALERAVNGVATCRAELSECASFMREEACSCWRAP